MRKTEALVILYPINDCNRRRVHGYVPYTAYSSNNVLLPPVKLQEAAT